MGNPQPIAGAPKDGRKVTVVWIDRDGQENQTIAQYRSPDMLKQAGAEADASDAGWWAYVDSDTQKRIEPHGWLPPDVENDSEADEER